MTDELYKPGLNAQIPYPLHTQYISEKRYMLSDRFEYRADNGKVIGEDAGYIYDLGSVPWWGQWFISRVAFGYAFTVHDIACDRGTWDDGTPISQKEADDLFTEVVEHVHHSRWMRFKGRVAWAFIRAHSRTVKAVRNKRVDKK